MAKFNDFEALKNNMAQKNSNFETEFNEYMRLSFLKEQIGKKNSEDIPYNSSIMVYSDGDIDNDSSLKKAYAEFQNKFKNDYCKKYNDYYDAYAIQAKDYFSRLKDQKAQPKEAEVAENKLVAEINQNESEKKKVCALFVDFDDCLNPKHKIPVDLPFIRTAENKTKFFECYSKLNELSAQFDANNIAFFQAYHDVAKENGFTEVCLYPFSTRITSVADLDTAIASKSDGQSGQAYSHLAQSSGLKYTGFPFDQFEKEDQYLTGPQAGNKSKIFQFLVTAHHIAKEHGDAPIDILVVDDNEKILEQLRGSFSFEASNTIPANMTLSTVKKHVKDDVPTAKTSTATISKTKFDGRPLPVDAILGNVIVNQFPSVVRFEPVQSNERKLQLPYLSEKQKENFKVDHVMRVAESPLDTSPTPQDLLQLTNKVQESVKLKIENITSQVDTLSTPVKDELITAITSAHNTLRELKRHHRRDSKDPNLSQDEKRLASEKYQAMKTIYNKFKQNLRNLDNALYSCMPIQNSNALANDNSNNNSSVTKIDNTPVNQAIYTFCKDCNHLFLAPKQSKQNSKDSNNELDKVYDTLKKPADDFGALVFKCRKFVMAVVRHGFFNALNKPTETRTTEILGSQAGKLKELAEKNKPTP